MELTCFIITFQGLIRSFKSYRMANDPISESAARTMGNFERPETFKVFKLCREGHYQELSGWLQTLSDQQGKSLTPDVTCSANSEE